MIEFLPFKLNEIHIVDSPFDEDPKNIIFFSKEALISGEGRSEKLGEWAITGTSVVMQIRGSQFRERISAPTPWYQNPCDASIFLHARPMFRKKYEKTRFSGQNFTFLWGLPLPKYKDLFKNFYMTKRLWI